MSIALCRTMLALSLLSACSADSPAGARNQHDQQVPGDQAIDRMECDRRDVLQAWLTAGPTVRAAAEPALLGNMVDVCTFLSTELPGRSRVDDRIRISQMMSSAGPAVREAAQQALSASNDEALRLFLASGWRSPWVTDQRMRVGQMIATGGPQLQAAGQMALVAGDVDALREFVDSGWRVPWETDQRMRVAQILAEGGPEVKSAAQRALDAKSADVLTDFIEREWPVAQARDQEAGTIADLVASVREAAKVVRAETELATEVASRALAEANAARESAEEAADAGARAQRNAGAAASAATQAAIAAENASKAARDALRAAAASNAAAKVAAGSAVRASALAVKGGEAAASARAAAGKARLDYTKAMSARVLADYSLVGAETVKNGLALQEQLRELAGAAKDAVKAARAAGKQARAAADAALKAGSYASQTGAEAARARAAAAAAVRNAERAIRAAEAAASSVEVALRAVNTAIAAAKRAIADATTAASAARDAADHAGQSANAAVHATEHADEAAGAATAAVEAATQARAVYEAARTAEAEIRAVTLEDALEEARALRDEAERSGRAEESAPTEASKRSQETNRLIAVATDPATPSETGVAAARRVALTLAGASGPWTQAAARDALSGDDETALDFVRTRISEAAAMDDRATLVGLTASTQSQALRAAAEAALDGSDEDVARFLASQDYPGRIGEDRMAVAQALAEAERSGKSATVQAAQRALALGSSEALRLFLDRERAALEASDDRVRVAQILGAEASGPELKAAAQIALEGPPGALHEFLDVGQHFAIQRDEDSVAHEHVVQALLSHGEQTASKALVDALQAQAVAAEARGAASAAAGYAQQAAGTADRAIEHAKRAVASAEQAQKSAIRASESARTAHGAAKRATESAKRAVNSARWAAGSAQLASRYARDAYASARSAFRWARSAGGEAQDAVNAVNKSRKILDDAIDEGRRAHWSFIRDAMRQCLNTPEPELCDQQIALLSSSPLIAAQQGGRFCELIWGKRGQKYEACLKQVLNPTFLVDQKWDAIAHFTKLVRPYMVGAYIGISFACGFACSIELAAITFATGLQSSEHFAINVALDFVGLGVGKAISQIIKVRRLAALEREIADLIAQDAARNRLWETVARRPFCTGRRSSFVRDTQVLMADGSSKSIQDIRAGDRVLSTDPLTYDTGSDVVSDAIRSTGEKRFVQLTVDIDGDAGVATAGVTATDSHPFWLPDLGRWMPAGQLRLGQRLVTSSDEPIDIVAKRGWTEHATVFDLSVSKRHSYYALAGRRPLLVHNQSTKCWEVEEEVEKKGVMALGITREGLHLLDAPYFSLVPPGEWEAAVRRYINDRNITLRVNLNGFRGAEGMSRAFDPFVDAVREGMKVGSDSTRREMAWIAEAIVDGKRSWESIEFWHSGKRVLSGPAPTPLEWRQFGLDFRLFPSRKIGTRDELAIEDYIRNGELNSVLKNPLVQIEVNLKGLPGQDAMDQFKQAIKLGLEPGARTEYREVVELARAIASGQRPWNSITLVGLEYVTPPKKPVRDGVFVLKDMDRTKPPFPEPDWKQLLPD